MSGTKAASTHVSIQRGPLVGPVLRRVVGMLAARADLPLDRLDDAVLVADLLAVRAVAHVPGETVDIEVLHGERELDMRVGPLNPGGGEALRKDAEVPGVGNLIEQLSDEIAVENDGEADFLRVHVVYSG